MARIETWYNQDLKEPVKVHYLDGNIFSADNYGNVVGVNVFTDGEPETLFGTVSANVIRSDGATVAVSGVASGNQAYIVMPQAACAVPGIVSIVIKLTNGSDITTLCAVVANVYQSSTDSTVDPGTVIPSIESLIDAIETAVASIPMDYSALSALATEIEGQFIPANKNIFDYRTIIQGQVLKNDGTISEVSSGYTSQLIPVQPSTTYHKRYVFNSSNIADIVYYNSSKTYLGYFGNSADGTFTTPSNCAYIASTGYTSQAAGDVIEKGSSFTSHTYFKGVLSAYNGGADIAYLVASSPVYYDKQNGVIRSLYNDGTGKIHLNLPGRAELLFDSPITPTGSGGYLYYDVNTNSFFLSSAETPSGSYYYRVAVLTAYHGQDLRSNADALFLIGNGMPIFKFDLIAKLLHVNTTNTVYVWYKNNYSTATSETYDLDITGTNVCIYFNVTTKRFVATDSFTSYRNDYGVIPVAYIHNNMIQSLVPYDLDTVSQYFYGKRMITYGDSLTWYDGQTFNTGAEQGNTCYGYQSYLRSYYGATILNLGQSGYTTPQIYGTITATTADLSIIDYIIFMPSIFNDDRIGVQPGTVQPIGGTFDTNTTAGAMQASIEYLLTANPALRIVIMVEPMGWTYRNGAPHLCNALLPVTIRQVAELYGLPIVDLWNESGINELTRNTFYNDPPFEDGNDWYMYHPNNYGWKRLSKIICQKLKSY